MLNLSKVTIVAALGALILGSFWGTSLLGSMKEDDKMSATHDRPVPSGGIPTKDTSAPKRTETATFALG